MNLISSFSLALNESYKIIALVKNKLSSALPTMNKLPETVTFLRTQIETKSS